MKHADGAGAKTLETEPSQPLSKREGRVAAPAAPIEPARRVTANRRGGAGDLVPRQAQRSRLARGRLVDLLV